MQKMNYIFILIFINLLSYSNANEYPTYEDHYCIRDCSVETRPLNCVYNFTVEWFMTLSYDCLNCPENIEDCFRKGCISAAGYQRPVRVVNRMLPGPSIQVCRYDTIIINVHSMLNQFEAITIHGHGVKQKGFPHMDGVGMLTQCPITPLTTFQYKYVINDRGTHWWHAHTSIHRTDGVFGSLIVREKKDIHRKLYDFDKSDHVMMFNDWTKEPLATKYQRYLFANGDERIDTILINGRGVNTNTTENATETPRAAFHVKKGFRYRFRLISAGAQYCPLEFSIDKHDLKVISTDGNPIKPVVVKSIVFMSAERFDVVVDANQDIDNYWIKIKGYADCIASEKFQTAILRYDGSLEGLPDGEVTYDTSGPDSDGLILNPSNTKVENNDKYIQISDLRAETNDKEEMLLLKKLTKKKVDKKVYLALDMNSVLNPEYYNQETFDFAIENDNVRTTPQVNNITFHLGNTPFFYQKKKIPENQFCNVENRSPDCAVNRNTFCSCIHRYKLNLYDVVEVIFVDGGTQQENHPFHLHGHSFAVLGMDKVGDFISIEDVKKMDREGKLKRNFKNPPLKDTIQIPSGGYVILRFYANNPGFWFNHCHIDFHADSGMALIWEVGCPKDLPPAPKNWPQCGDYKVEDDHLY